MKYLSFAFSLFIAGSISLIASPTKDRYSSETKRYGLFWQRSAVGTEFISLLPGIQYRSSNLIANAPNGAKLRMPDEEKDETRFFFDIKSRDYHFGEYWGVFLLYQNFDFDLTKQTINKSYGGLADTGTTVYGSNNRVNQVGTELNGNITNLFPLFYIGDKAREEFRIGFGIGPSKIHMKGNPDFYNGWNEEAPVLALAGTGSVLDKIDRFGDLSLLRNGKPESDPVNVYLLSNLGTPGNLETFGLYQFGKGNVNLNHLNLYSYYLLSQNTEANLSPLQIISLMSVGKSDFRLKEKYVSSFYFFFEIPFYDVTFRFGYGGPIYYQEDYRIRFHNVDLSVFIPIDI